MSPYRTPAEREPEAMEPTLRRLLTCIDGTVLGRLVNLSGFRWYRRTIGGHWEFWTAFGYGSWISRPHGTVLLGHDPRCEDYQ